MTLTRDFAGMPPWHEVALLDPNQLLHTPNSSLQERRTLLHLRRAVSPDQRPGQSDDGSIPMPAFYDDAGNRTGLGIGDTPVQAFAFDPANQISDSRFSYDAAGNRTTAGGTTATYDALNRLTSLTKAGVTTDYAYDGDGNLVGITRGGVTTNIVQDTTLGLPQMLQKGSTTYLYGNSRLGLVQGGSRVWTLDDYLGSVRHLADDSGHVLAAYDYDAWGVGKTDDGLGFTGELQDNGLVYLRARWYDPAFGTFTSVDPFDGFDRTPYSMHPYQYGYSQPTNLTDPSGKCIPYWVPWIGEPGCTLENGIGNGSLDIEGFEQYSADVVLGLGLPGAMIGDAITGGNTTQRILSRGRLGTYLGGGVVFLLGLNYPVLGNGIGFAGWSQSAGNLLRKPCADTWMNFGVNSLLMWLSLGGTINLSFPSGSAPAFAAANGFILNAGGGTATLTLGLPQGAAEATVLLSQGNGEDGTGQSDVSDDYEDLGTNWEDNGTRGQFRPAEAELAQRIQSQLGVKLERFNPSVHPMSKYGDWIDSAGITYDGVGPVQPQYFDYSSFTKQIIKHLRKQGLDNTVVDLTGLESNQMDSVIKFLSKLSPTEKSKIIVFH